MYYSYHRWVFKKVCKLILTYIFFLGNETASFTIISKATNVHIKIMETGYTREYLIQSPLLKRPFSIANHFY